MRQHVVTYVRNDLYIRLRNRGHMSVANSHSSTRVRSYTTFKIIVVKSASTRMLNTQYKLARPEHQDVVLVQCFVFCTTYHVSLRQ